MASCTTRTGIHFGASSATERFTSLHQNLMVCFFKKQTHARIHVYSHGLRMHSNHNNSRRGNTRGYCLLLQTLNHGITKRACIFVDVLAHMCSCAWVCMCFVREGMSMWACAAHVPRCLCVTGRLSVFAKKCACLSVCVCVKCVFVFVNK